MTPQDDPAHELLRWLLDPRQARRARSEEEWSSFRRRCREAFGLDPGVHDALTVAQRLGARQGRLDEAWRRFEETPELYPGMAELLERADPAERTPSGDESSWPLRDRRREEELRDALRALEDAPFDQVVETLRSLEASHGERRTWVWAKLGYATLARTLPHLLRIAELTATFADDAVEPKEEIAAAVREALETPERDEDLEAVRIALQALDPTAP